MSNVAITMGQAAAANSFTTGAWDLEYAYYDPDNAWNVSTMVQTNTFIVSAQESTPEGIFFKPDGTRMYIVGSSGDEVNEYSLSTAWKISTASYVQVFSVSAQDTVPVDIFFKPDGTKFYIVGQTGDDVNEYSLSTAWDVSTASYVQNFSVATQESEPEGIFFKPDGTKMYIVGANGDEVNEYDLSTAWDISTASYLQNFSVSAQESNPRSISFKPDGTKMFILGDTGNDITEYNLSTAWDISTASFVQASAAVFETAPYGLFFKPDGSRVYVIGTTNDTVYEYTLGGFSVASEELTPAAMSFKTDGTKMYIVGTSGDEINEYNLTTGWDLSTASYLQTLSVSAQETLPRAFFFKPDGTKMYICGASGDDVNEYNLSTAWDISTASFVQLFSISSQEGNPTGLFFKPDGTKMYVCGTAGDDVNEYNLSTAWDVSTASYVQNFSISAQDTSPVDISFKSDGTKMFVLGDVGDDVNEYSLSTAWDVSTASYVQNFNIADNGGVVTPSGFFFRENGSEFYVTDTIQDRVYKYTVLNNQ